LGTPPQNEPRILILRWQGVNAFLARYLLAGPGYPGVPAGFGEAPRAAARSRSRLAGSPGRVLPGLRSRGSSTGP